MADDDTASKEKSIPVWQRAAQPSEDTKADKQPSSKDEDASTAELSLHEQARCFLDDESIRGASRKRKVEFLKTKGLQGDDIETLLDSLETASSSADGELKTVFDSNNTTHSTSAATTTTPSTPSPSQSGPLQPQPPTEARIAPRADIPPIITYPEFLLKPQKPPPLVTIERLTNAVYVIAGISALTYGASKYLVGPMLESLTEARHELASTAQDSITKFNTKLESTVSHVPYIPSLHRPKPLDDLSDTSSVDSDPTELFHRDFATQTSPPRSRSSSVSDATTPVSDPVSSQTTRLTSLHTTLSTLLSSTTSTFATDNFSTTLSSLQTTIDSLENNAHPMTTPLTTSNYNNSSPSWQTSASSTSSEKPSETEATKFKAEIRALKGAFLSSRNFPTATRATQPFVLPAR